MWKILFYKSCFHAKERVKTWRKLAALLKYNVDQLQALTQLQARYAARRHPLAFVFAQVIAEINKGQTLAIAFQPWIPAEESMLLSAGHQSASLPETLQDCVKLIEAKQKISGCLVKAFSYPLLLIVALIGLLFLISVYLVPELSQITNPQQWVGAAALLYSFSQFFSSSGGVFFILLITGLIIASLVTLPAWTGPLRLKLENIPPWSIYRLITGSVWLFTTATLLRANIPFDRILSDMLDGDQLRPWLFERIAIIRRLYSQDANFGNVLLQMDMNFPDREIAEDLAVYAQMPNFHTEMYAIAAEWLDQGVEKVTQNSKIVNMTLLALVMFTICFFGIAVTSIQQQITMGDF